MDSETVTVDPLRLERNAMELVIIGLALKEAVEVTLLSESAGSVDRLLGPVWAAVWAVTLLAGSGLTLAGIAWPGRSLTGASLLQIGYAAFAPGSLARGVALFAAGRPEDAGVMFFFGAMCLLRLVQIERRIGQFYPAGYLARFRRWRVRRG